MSGIDDLIIRIKRLVKVREQRRLAGAGLSELVPRDEEIRRLRVQLADMVRDSLHAERV